MHCVKNNLFSAWRLEMSANFNENYRRYNFQAFANIYGNFPEISHHNICSVFLCKGTLSLSAPHNCNKTKIKLK